MGLSIQAIVTCDTCGATGACIVAGVPTPVPFQGVVSPPPPDTVVGPTTYPTGWAVGVSTGGVAFYCPTDAAAQPSPPSPAPPVKPHDQLPSGVVGPTNYGPSFDPLIPTGVYGPPVP